MRSSAASASLMAACKTPHGAQRVRTQRRATQARSPVTTGSRAGQRIGGDDGTHAAGPECGDQGVQLLIGKIGAHLHPDRRLDVLDQGGAEAARQ